MAARLRRAPGPAVRSPLQARFRLLGNAAGYRPGWAHHQYATAVRTTTPPERVRHLMQELDRHLDALVAAGRAPEALQGRLHVVGRRHGAVVLQFAQEAARGVGWGADRQRQAQQRFETLLRGFERVVVLGLPLADPPLLLDEGEVGATGSPAMAALR